MSNYLFKHPVYPFSNVNQQLTNPFAVNNPIGFGSNESPSRFGLPEPQSNIQAANSYIPGLTKGGYKRRTLKHKIKNIVLKYKGMKKTKTQRNSMINKLKKSLGLKGGRKGRKSANRRGASRNASRGVSRSASRGRSRSRSLGLRGGYHQYQSNIPNTPSFSVGSKLSSSELGLANPPPIKVLNISEGNNIDNYNHYLKNSHGEQAGRGFQFW